MDGKTFGILRWNKQAEWILVLVGSICILRQFMTRFEYLYCDMLFAWRSSIQQSQQDSFSKLGMFGFIIRPSCWCLRCPFSRSSVITCPCSIFSKPPLHLKTHMATLGVYLPKRDFVVITTVWLKTTNKYLVRPPQDLCFSDSHVM